MTTVCHAVSRFDSMRDRKRNSGGPCLLPLYRRPSVKTYYQTLLREGGALEHISGPEEEHGEDLQPTRLDRRPSQQMVNHPGNTWPVLGLLSSSINLGPAQSLKLGK